jgi:hypothetical protein
MTSPPENLSGPGKPLKAEPPEFKEFEGLKRSGHARLRDALNTSLAIESRFDLAYNAAHARPRARDLAHSVEMSRHAQRRGI